MTAAVPLEKSIASGQRILLIGGDRVDGCKLLESFLTREGHDVRMTGGRREALNIAVHFSPDAIFLDLCLPAMNGLEVCAILRRSGTTKDAAIYALSECADRHLRDFSGSFAKPLDLNAIARVLVGASEAKGAVRL
jgi:CheY-like chemotaxis protein